MLRFEYHTASRTAFTQKKRELRSFQVGKNLRIKIITIGGVGSFIVIDGILQSVASPRSIFVLARGKKKRENKWQKEEKPLPFNVLMANLHFIESNAPLFCVQIWIGGARRVRLTEISVKKSGKLDVKNSNNKFSVELQGKKQFVDETNRKADLNS